MTPAAGQGRVEAGPLRQEIHWAVLIQQQHWTRQPTPPPPLVTDFAQDENRAPSAPGRYPAA